MAVLMDGKALSQALMEQLKIRVDALKGKGVSVGLAVILVGDDPASQVYVRNKGLACESLGIYSETLRLPAETTQEELEAEASRPYFYSGLEDIGVKKPKRSHPGRSAKGSSRRGGSPKPKKEPPTPKKNSGRRR